jgi:hypothetical protein
MGRSLSSKHRKRRRDQARAYAAGEMPKRHKVAVERSKKALKKKAYPAT